MSSAQREQIEQLFRRYGNSVGSYLLARTGDANLAESLTAQVFLLVVRHWSQCQGSTVAWLWAIVKRVLAEHYRKGRRERSLQSEPAAASVSPAEHVEQQEQQERLQVALEKLSAEQQRLIYLKFYARLKNTEIAAAVGQTPSHVGVQLHRTLLRLRELLRTKAAGSPEQ